MFTKVPTLTFDTLDFSTFKHYKYVQYPMSPMVNNNMKAVIPDP